MFRASSWIATLTILCIGVLWLSYLCLFKESAFSISQKSKFKQSLRDSAVATAEQSRKKVRKDIWISQPNHQRLQNRIDSETSRLILQPKGTSQGGSMEVFEQLHNVQCWSQEKIFSIEKTPGHQMRILQAAEGVYKYKTQTFEASKATLALYKIPGLSLTMTPEAHQAFLKGTASQISFAVESGVPLFQAHQFKASLSQGSK